MAVICAPTFRPLVPADAHGMAINIIGDESRAISRAWRLTGEIFTGVTRESPSLLLIEIMRETNDKIQFTSAHSFVISIEAFPRCSFFSLLFLLERCINSTMRRASIDIKIHRSVHILDRFKRRSPRGVDSVCAIREHLFRPDVKRSSCTRNSSFNFQINPMHTTVTASYVHLVHVNRARMHDTGLRKMNPSRSVQRPWDQWRFELYDYKRGHTFSYIFATSFTDWLYDCTYAYTRKPRAHASESHALLISLQRRTMPGCWKHPYCWH